MREIHNSDFFFVSVDDERRILRRARTARGFDTFVEVQEAYESMLRALEQVDRSTYALLVDMRLAPPRNDPGFEELIGRYYPRLYGGYPRIAVVAKTQAGKLQITRVAQVYGYDIRTFMMEAEALAYLQEGGAPARATPPVESRGSRLPGRRGI